MAKELIFILFILVIILISFLPGKKSSMNKKREYEPMEISDEDANVVGNTADNATTTKPTSRNTANNSANTTQPTSSRVKKSVRFSNERKERLYSVGTGETLKDLVGKT